MTKKKKYFVAGAAALLLIAAAILISTVGLFGISYEKVETGSKVLENDVFIAYYPDFTEPVRRSFFYFNDEDILISAESKEIKEKFLPDFSSADETYNGTRVYYSNSEKWSRPAVYGDIVLKTSKYGIYNSNRNEWVLVFTKTEKAVENAYLEILESYSKDDLK